MQIMRGLPAKFHYFWKKWSCHHPVPSSYVYASENVNTNSYKQWGKLRIKLVIKINKDNKEYQPAKV